VVDVLAGDALCATAGPHFSALSLARPPRRRLASDGNAAGRFPEPGGRKIRAMKKVRFAPSPAGSLNVGNALGAVIKRREGDHLLLRIDDTDPARNVAGGEDAILRDLE
jgi:hypothetical protein